MEIRFAEIKDVPGILALLRQVGKVHHDLRPDLFRENAQKYSASGVLALLEDSNTPIFVAAEEEKVLGYCFCQMHRTEKDPVLTDRETLYIDDLCVDENCRGQHIGKALYDTVCRYARQRRCYNVTLNVYADNVSALRFYEKLGLKKQKIGMENIL